MKKILILLLFLIPTFGQGAELIKGTSDVGIKPIKTDSLGNLVISTISGGATNKYTTVDTLFIATATDTVTTSWQNLGEVIDMTGYTQLNIYATIDINSSNNIRIRAIGKRTPTIGEYPFMIETISSVDIKVDAEYIEFNTDADQSGILRIETQGVPYIQLQYQAGTVGATPGQIDSVYINKIWF